MIVRRLGCIAGLLLLIHLVCYAQEKKIPDGTDGIYFKEDSLAHEPMKDSNEVVAVKSPFKIGPGIFTKIYGYVILNRFQLKGESQLFESRVQFTVM